MKEAHRGLRRKLAETTYLIDATSVRLNEHSATWARFSAGAAAPRFTWIHDADADRPIYAAVSSANVYDITAAHQMPIEPAPTMSLISAITTIFGGRPRCRWLPDRYSLQIQHPADVVKELPVTKGSNILSDCIGFLPARQAKSRRNPMRDAVREVQVTTDTGKVLRILSNDLDASAEVNRQPLSPALGYRAASAGSSRPSRSPASSGVLRMPCASRSLSLSSPSCCCAWLRQRKRPSKAQSSSAV